jgi:hypothetical protein
MICGEGSIVNQDGSSGIAITLRCRAWTCQHCRRDRKRQLINLAVAGQPNRLITLTVSPALLISPAARAKALANAWRLVVKRAKRAFGWDKLDYLAVFEATKRGEPHLHILARCGYIPQAWLSHQMKALIGSPIVDIRAVKNPKHAAIYVAKYIGKAPHRFATCKRYWHTKEWDTTPPDQEERSPWGTGRWEMSDDNVMTHFQRHGGWHGKAWMIGREICFWGTPPPGVDLSELHTFNFTPDHWR